MHSDSLRGFDAQDTAPFRPPSVSGMKVSQVDKRQDYDKTVEGANVQDYEVTESVNAKMTKKIKADDCVHLTFVPLS